MGNTYIEMDKIHHLWRVYPIYPVLETLFPSQVQHFLHHQLPQQASMAPAVRGVCGGPTIAGLSGSGWSWGQGYNSQVIAPHERVLNNWLSGYLLI